MKNSNHLFAGTLGYSLFILAFIVVFTACKEAPKKEETNKPETEEIVEVNYIYWNVKAIFPDGKRSLDVKAFDSEGKSFDIMALQDSDQDIFLDVKAIADGVKLPVKILVNDEQFAPVSVISDEGNIYDLKAITENGNKLEIKGIRRFGNIVMIKAITEKGKYVGLKAISPEGKQNDIKGIKVNRGERELVLNGVTVHAHVKAMHTAANEAKFKMYKKSEINKKRTYKSDFDNISWNLNVITADGKNFVVKAVDQEGNQIDVKAVQDSDQHSFMDIKAFTKEYILPVKVMQTEDEHAPVCAVSSDGLYQLKAISEDNVQYDIKGIGRSGRIINVKAINENGEFFDVKAIAPNGKTNYVHGIKIFDKEVEMTSKGHPVYAHLKALHQ
jgi:hypothetical protein